MNIKFKLISLLLITIIAVGVFLFNSYKTVESEKSIEFEINKDFISLRKSIVQGRFEEEIMRINNAVVLEKKWSEKKFYLERPFQKDRYWEFDGTMNARIKVLNKDVNEINMIHNVQVTSNQIKVNALLENPIEKIGLSELIQDIELEPKLNKTKAKVSIKMKLKRLIPGFMEKYAKDQLDKESENRLINIVETLKNLPDPKTGIFIPLGGKNAH